MPTPVLDIPVLEVKPLAPTARVVPVMYERMMKVGEKITIPVKGGKVIDAHAALAGFNMEYPKDDHEIRQINAILTTTFTADHIVVAAEGTLRDDTHRAEVTIKCLVIATILVQP